MKEDIQYNIAFALTKQTIYPESKFVEIKQKNGQLITFGDNNLFPQYLDGLYDNSSLHSGIINKKVNYIYGNGLYSETGSLPLIEFINKCNSKGDSFNHVYKKIVEDSERYGGFALEIINNMEGEMQDIYYIDMSNLRISGSEDKILYSKDWKNKVDKKKVTIYDMYTPGYSGSASSIFWYKGNARGYYPKPPYNGALMGIEQLTELDKLGLSSIQNGFFPSLWISIPGDYTDEQKESVQETMLEKWGGTTQAGKVMISFKGSQDESPTITPVAQPDIVDRTNQQRTNAIDSIFFGHQISVKSIFGIQTAGKLGLSKEFQEGTEVFVQDYVKPAQRELMEVLNHLLSIKFPNSDLSVNMIEPIGSSFENELAMVANMTQDEVRTELKRMGKVESIEIPKGAQMAILPIRGDTPTNDLPIPPTNDENINPINNAD